VGPRARLDRRKFSPHRDFIYRVTDGNRTFFEMISTHLFFFFNEKAILLQKNFRNCMPFVLHIMNER